MKLTLRSYHNTRVFTYLHVITSIYYYTIVIFISTETSNCGGSLNITTGWLGVSNNADLLGVESFDCLWTITAKQLFRVLLRVLNLQIGWSSNCDDTYLAVCTLI